MRSIVLVTLFVCLSFLSMATNYYFSTSIGDDLRSVEQAQAPITPWKTIAKLNAMFPGMLPGDSLLFKRGENYYGTVIVSSSGSQQPIVIAAYGVGSNPTITGFATLSGWVSLGSNKWKTTCSGCKNTVNMLRVGDVPFPAGRYPDGTDANGGYLTVTAHVNNEKIIDTNLTAGINWAGADIVIRKNRWIVDKHSITAQNQDTISYNNTDWFGYPPTDHYGYFIQNHPAAINRFGEWCFNTFSKEIQIELSNSAILPTVEVSTIDTLFIIHNSNNIVVSDLTFRGSNLAAIDIENSHSIKISNCRFEYNGANAINAYLGNGLSVLNNFISYSNNNAFMANSCFSTTIKGNSIQHTGLLVGSGKNNDDSYQAIILRGNNNIIEQNKLDSTGYIPIRFEGDSVLVKNNFITNFCIVKDDGGGIYTWHSFEDTTANINRTIIGNLIINGVGNGAGTANPNYLPAAGIYCDGNAGNVTIVDNTVANCKQSGLYFNNPHDMNIKGNLIYNNGTQLMISHGNESVNSFCGNNNVKNNILVSKETAQLAKVIESVHNDIYSLSQSDSNYYCRPLDDNFVISSNAMLLGATTNYGYSLEQWRKIAQ